MKKPEVDSPQAPSKQENSPSQKQDVRVENSYTTEELVVLGRIKDILNGDFFHHLPTEAITESNKETPTAIVNEARALIAKIRKEKRDQKEFFTYQDEHFDNPHYAFLEEEYPGLNVNGWRVLMAELNPIKYGTAIQRKDYHIYGTISQRSAKL